MSLRRGCAGAALLFVFIGLPALLSLKMLQMKAGPGSTSAGFWNGLGQLQNFHFGQGASPSSLNPAQDASASARIKSKSASASTTAPDTAATENAARQHPIMQDASLEMSESQAGNTRGSPLQRYGDDSEGGPLENSKTNSLAENSADVTYGNKPSSSSTANKKSLSGKSLNQPANEARPGAGKTAKDPGPATVRSKFAAEQTTGANQDQLMHADIYGQQATNMAQRPGLMDGAKDHAGKMFDGNFKTYKGIPVEKYNDVFNKQSFRVEPPTVDLSK